MSVKVRLTKERISVDKALSDVRSPSAGGTVVFIGTVRDMSEGRSVSRIELEAAVALAEEDLTRICASASKRFEILSVSVIHRLGPLAVGDTIIVIAVAAAHRADAFKACKYIIDELKKTTPIWKKEFSGRAGRWVERVR